MHPSNSFGALPVAMMSATAIRELLVWQTMAEGFRVPGVLGAQEAIPKGKVQPVVNSVLEVMDEAVGWVNYPWPQLRTASTASSNPWADPELGTIPLMNEDQACAAGNPAQQ